LAPGGKYHHARIATEVEVDERGIIRYFGKRRKPPKGSLIKDVVILRKGETLGDIILGTTRANDIAEIVFDLKTGKYGAKVRQFDTMERFGVSSVKRKPFTEIGVTRPQRRSLYNKLKKLKGAIRVLPASMIVIVVGVTAAEAEELAAAGDLDAAIARITGMDTLTDIAESAGDAVERRFQEQLDATKKSRNAMEEEYQRIMNGGDQ
jgi:hypothetical protein